MAGLRAISVHQPWAHAILHLGKDVENRTWSTEWRGWVAIHASKNLSSYTRESKLDWKALYGVELPEPEKMAYGAILGAVRLTDCTTKPVDSRWAEANVVHWLLRHARILSDPIPFRGRQGLFTLPPAVEEAVVRRLGL